MPAAEPDSGPVTSGPGVSPGASADPASVPSDPRVEKLLHAAVAELGGTERPGQIVMANAVARAMADDEHLLVQAGTGTGKSLAYLVPAFEHATATDRPVVVATATLALQSQLVKRDLPNLVRAIGSDLRRQPTYAIFKGRHNYACLNRVIDGVPDDQGALVEVQPTGPLGRSVVALREWAKKEAENGGSGDRDDAPSHTDRAWGQVSVGARECLGERCAYFGECFSERARATARASDVIVTNHALLAIDAIEGFQVLPEHEIVIVDEAHELVARVTSAASAELSPQLVERAARRAQAFCEGDEPDRLDDAASGLKAALTDMDAGRLDALPGALGDAIAVVRDSARSVSSALPKEKDTTEAEAGLRVAKGLVDQVRGVAERIATWSPHDVVWINQRDNFGPELEVAPLSVAGLLRERVFSQRTCILTSATLELGGDFGPTARSLGLRPTDRLADDETAEDRYVGAEASRSGDAGAEPGAEADEAPEGPRGAGPTGPVPGDVVDPVPWRALNVGSPFDYGKQAILYVARRLPPPGRGISPAALDELCELVDALGGRTLGLFSSRKAAEEATAAVRERTGLEVLCQGDAQLTELNRRFVDEPDTSLFGTLSLWQGLDVPGDTCQLVVVDRLPFPRPDDPLMSARQRAVDEAGGNGFMAVAATHAALLLAQGVGRLIRRSTDRGVVAILDSRLSTARYGTFLRASLPPMWFTVDRAVAAGALRRLRQARA
ncbi:MAG TPA: ATP-dependent DNA helicase [Actinopolymorphaceae bacterium]